MMLTLYDGVDWYFIWYDIQCERMWNYVRLH